MNFAGFGSMGREVISFVMLSEDEQSLKENILTLPGREKDIGKTKTERLYKKASLSACLPKSPRTSMGCG